MAVNTHYAILLSQAKSHFPAVTGFQDIKERDLFWLIQALEQIS